MKISGEFVTGKYLKIQDADYKDFLLTMPIVTDKGECPVVNEEYKEDDYFTEFTFSSTEYELCLRQGSWYFGSDDDMMSTPLPRAQDEQVKNIILKTLNGDFKISGFGQIEVDELPDFISILQTNSIIEGMPLSYDQIYNSLIRIQETRIYIRKKGLVRWYGVPWILMVHFGTIDADIYPQLVH